MNETWIQVGVSDKVAVELHTLLDTRLLLTGNSGAGKSWAFRRLAEALLPLVQTIVIDPEGEFVSLAEKFDVVVVSNDTSIKPHPKLAAKLARKLLELRVSAVVDLSDLSWPDRREFVEHFATGLMALPQSLWNPLALFIDETHRFAPERGAGTSVSTDALIAVASQGRKRGFALFPATQRLSKLHKDLAAEANNIMIGRTALDNDLSRAQDMLGMGKKDGVLRTLKAGEWFGYGPAFRHEGVLRFKVGPVITTHPRAGQRAIHPPEPSKKIQKVIGELRELPQVVVQEERDLAHAVKRIAELEKELRKKPAPLSNGHDVQAAVEAERKRVMKDVRTQEHAVQKQFAQADKNHADAKRELSRIRTSLDLIEAKLTMGERIPRVADPLPAEESAPRRRAVRTSGKSDGGLRRILVALAQHGPQDRDSLARFADLSKRSGAYSTYLSAGKQQGVLEIRDGVFMLTYQGLKETQDVEPLPKGSGLLEYWCSHPRVTGKAEEMLRVLYEQGPHSRDTLAEAVGLSSRSGTYSTYLSTLRGFKLVNGSAELWLSEEFHA